MDISNLSLLDRSSIVFYKGKITLPKPTCKNEDIPKYAINDCERISKIIEKETNESFELYLAYHLWHFHSKYSFSSSWESIGGVSDSVIAHNIFGLLSCADYSK